MTGRLMKVWRAVKMNAISRRPAIGDRAEDDRRLAVQRASLPPVQAEGIEHQRPHEQDARQDGEVPRKRRQRRGQEGDALAGNHAAQRVGERQRQHRRQHIADDVGGVDEASSLGDHAAPCSRPGVS